MTTYSPYPSFVIETAASSLEAYHQHRKYSSNPISWNDVADEIYASPATNLEYPKGYFGTDGDLATDQRLELKGEALRRFSERITYRPSQPEFLQAVIDFLLENGFLKELDLVDPMESHHARCKLARVLGTFCFDTPKDALSNFAGQYIGLHETDTGDLVENVMSAFPAPDSEQLTIRESLLIFQRRPGELASRVSGRRHRLEFDDVIIRYGTAALNCRKNLQFAFAAVEGDDVLRSVEASIATMRNVTYCVPEVHGVLERPTSFELHGDHPLYDCHVAKFERIEGKKRLDRLRRVDAKLAKWKRRA